ncbi:MAG: DNA polymerase [Rubrobacter sp.]
MSKNGKTPKPTPNSLEPAVWRELGIELDKGHQTAPWGGELSPGMLEYAAKDARVLLALADTLVTRAREAGLERVAEIEHRALPAVSWMENSGLPLDAVGWKGYLGGLERELGILERQLDEIASGCAGGGGRNWRSAPQSKEFFEQEGFQLPNVKAETLSGVDHPVVGPLLRYRKASQLVSHFGPGLLESVREDGRVYANWHQIGAETGRMSCSGPNLQQFPPVLKDYVRAPVGRLIVAADYSQAEVRIAAQISGDKRMLEAYGRGEDLHATTARSLMGRERISNEERDLAKAVNFGLLYGQGAAGLMEYARNKYGVTMTTEEAQRYRRRFFGTYPGLKAWHEHQWRRLKQGSTTTRTLSGRRRKGVRSFTERVNTPIQGTGADGQKLALALLYERRLECPGAFPIACVHDEVAVECGEDQVAAVAAWLARAMKDGMAEVLALGAGSASVVPVEVEVRIGEAWGSGQPT